MKTVMMKDMRLMPPYKKDKDGNNILDGKIRKWYTNFRWKFNGKKCKTKVQVSLDAYEPEVRKAIENLSAVFIKLRTGVHVSGLNKPIKDLAQDEQFNHEQLPKWKSIRKFFGEYKVADLTPELIAEYMEFQWGLNEDDELQVMKSTWKKQKQVFNSVVQTVEPSFNISSILEKLEFHEVVNKQLPPLTPLQIYKATQKANGFWGDIFFIMLYTGMEARDIWDLKPKHIAEGIIEKQRHKTKFRGENMIKIPIIPQLKAVLGRHPIPLDKNECIFKFKGEWRVFGDTVSTNIQNIFKSAGLEGYGAKSIRRYLGEEIHSQYSHEVDRMAKQALAHSKSSKVTKQYTRARLGDLETILIRLVNNIEEAGANNEALTAQ